MALMKNKAVFLDRDGTINIEKKYVYRVEEFEFLPGALEALYMLQRAGYKLVIITNQSGIARGYYSEQEYQKLTEWMLNVMRKQNINIDRIYYCPHHPEAKIDMYKKVCDCRKPRVGLYKRAISELGLDLTKCFAVGDKIRDCAICFESQCQGFLIGNNEKEEIIQNVKSGIIQNVSYALDLYECAKIIINK